MLGGDGDCSCRRPGESDAACPRASGLSDGRRVGFIDSLLSSSKPRAETDGLRAPISSCSRGELRMILFSFPAAQSGTCAVSLGEVCNCSPEDLDVALSMLAPSGRGDCFGEARDFGDLGLLDFAFGDALRLRPPFLRPGGVPGLFGSSSFPGLKNSVTASLLAIDSGVTCLENPWLVSSVSPLRHLLPFQHEEGCSSNSEGAPDKEGSCSNGVSLPGLSTWASPPAASLSLRAPGRKSDSVFKPDNASCTAFKSARLLRSMAASRSRSR